MSSYRTVAAAFRFEPERVKNSRFIADVLPIADEAEGLAHVDRLWQEFPDANHVCWAWRLGAKGERHRHADDGEPGGSAGLPILRRIEGQELSHVLVCVTRWFGGVKLGVGGLVRAYGGACGMALDRAEIVVVQELVRLTVDFDYDDSRALDGVLKNSDATILESFFDARVRHLVELPLEQVGEVERRLVDASRGRATVRRLDD